MLPVLVACCVGFVALVAAMWACRWGAVPRFGPDPLTTRTLATSAGLSVATARRGSPLSAPACNFDTEAAA